MKSLLTILAVSLLSCAFCAAQGADTQHANDEPRADVKNPVFRVGGGVAAPKPKSTPDPDLTKEQRESLKNPERQGKVILRMIIDRDGYPRNVKVDKTLAPDLDQKALEAVRKWRFDPAIKDVMPVAVQISVEVNFRPY